MVLKNTVKKKTMKTLHNNK